MDFSKLDEVCLKWEGSYRSALLEMGHWVGWGTIENFARNQQSVHPTAFGAGMRARIAHWLVSLAYRIAPHGGG